MINVCLNSANSNQVLVIKNLIFCFFSYILFLNFSYFGIGSINHINLTVTTTNFFNNIILTDSY